MAEETKLPVVETDADFESFANAADARDVAAALGKPASAEESKKVAEVPKKEEKLLVEESAEEPKKASVHKLSWGELRNRVRELEAENRGLREGRREPVREEPKAEEVPAKVEELRARPNPDDKNEKGENKYKSWQEYEDDLLSWHGEKTIAEFEQRGAKKATEAQIEQVNKLIEQDWHKRCEAAAEAHEDFEEALDPEVGPGRLIQPGSIVDEWLMDSELGAEMLYFFHKNPTELKKFEDIAGPTPGARRAAARRMLMKIEAQIAPTGKRAEESDETEQPKPAEKEVRISKTPPPTREVGGRGAAPTDRARAAVANDDVGTYMDEMDRRDIATRFGARR